MIIVPITETEVRKRQRSIMDKVKLSELKESIADKGILHPPVYWFDNNTETWVLTAGERRSEAMRQLHAENRPFTHEGTIVVPGTIPITKLGEYVDEIARFEVELDENVRRDDLTWQDRVKAYADLHEMRLKTNPKQTQMDTARELLDKGLVKTIHGGRLHMKEATLIADHLDNEKIAKARNPAEALSLVYKLEEERVTAALVKRKLAAAPTQSPITLLNGDATTVLDGLDSDMADLILTDPPYGLGASGAGFRGRTVHHHNYEDTKENAQKIARAILTEGFRIAKNRANIFMFCDIDLFDWLKSTASNMGWSPFRRPLIWQKSESEGMAPWGGSGPRITTEFIFYATKGQRGLNASPIDVFNIKRVSRSERIHAAEKPVELLKTLIQISTLPGDFILDPCCGSGSTLVAAKELKRTGIGIEFDKDYYNTAMANVFGKDLSTHGEGT
jgi:site-specific DNA-methyltransferase (adenine-specific)